MRIIVFEDDSWRNFLPISLTRHLSAQILGTTTNLQRLVTACAEIGDIELQGRDYLMDVAREETGLPYNRMGEGRGSVLLINARINSLAPSLGDWIGRRKGSFSILDGGTVALALLGDSEVRRLKIHGGVIATSSLATLAKQTEVLRSSEPLLFNYPWEILAINDKAIEVDAQERVKNSGMKPSRRGAKRLSTIINKDVSLEDHVVVNCESGPVVIEEGTLVESFSRISGPCYIGRKTVIHSALIRRGTTIGEQGRIGGEVEHSIVYPYTNKAHFGFLGHSIVGSWVNLGAGSTTSDLKNTYGTIRVAIESGERVDSGMIKLGAIVGDMAKVAIGTMIYGGKRVGVGSQCSGTVDADVLDFFSVSGFGQTRKFELDIESVVRTQGRMMGRRNLALTHAMESLIRGLHRRVTNGEPPSGERQNLQVSSSKDASLET